MLHTSPEQFFKWSPITHAVEITIYNKFFITQFFPSYSYLPCFKPFCLPVALFLFYFDYIFYRVFLFLHFKACSEYIFYMKFLETTLSVLKCSVFAF